MLNKSENYKYIWSVIQDYLNNDKSEKNIRFIIPENSISAYLEVNNDVLSNNAAAGNEIFVNPFLRFNDYILEYSESDTDSEKATKEALNNFILHLFGNIDLLEGMNAYDIILSIIAKNVENGEFGENAKIYFEYLSKDEKRIVAKYLKKYYDEESSMNIFLRVFKEVFLDSIVYLDRLKKRNIVLYVNYKKTKENRMKIKLLTELFIPLDYKVRTMWENHVGVIGVEETLKIGEMIVF